MAGWMLEIDFIAAVVLGEISMKGGRGSIAGTVIARLLLECCVVGWFFSAYRPITSSWYPAVERKIKICETQSLLLGKDVAVPEEMIGTLRAAPVEESSGNQQDNSGGRKNQDNLGGRKNEKQSFVFSSIIIVHGKRVGRMWKSGSQD